MDKIKSIYVSTYDFEVFYLVSPWKTFVKLIEKDNRFNFSLNKDYKGTGYATSLVNDNGRHSYFVWIHNQADDSVVAHEAFHAVVDILEGFAGCKLTSDSEEAYAYLVCFLVREMFKICRPSKLVKRRVKINKTTKRTKKKPKTKVKKTAKKEN